MKWSELLKIAEEKGFVLKRHGKCHDIYINHKPGQMLVMERHGNQEIRTSLMHKLKKELGF